MERENENSGRSLVPPGPVIVQRGPRAALPGLIPYGILLLGAYLTFGHSVDDAYITYRYASNLVAGHGPVFNVGERVEGFSSPLHLLLSALLLMIAPGVDIYFKGKLLSLLFSFGTVAVLGRTARLCGLSKRAAILAQILLALNINFAMASVNGLETTLYAFLVTAALAQFLSETKREITGWTKCRSALLLFLAVLARPDALLISVALLVIRIAWGYRRREDLINAARWAVTFTVPTLLFILARYAYFGSPLPNTYYAKNVSLHYGIVHGIPYLLHGLMPYHRNIQDLTLVKSVLKGHGSLAEVLLLVSFPIFWGLALFGLHHSKKRLGSQACAAVIVALALFVLRTGGDWMSGWRFMTAALPCFAILQVYGLHALADSIAHWRARGQRDSLSRSHFATRAPLYVAAVCLWGLCLLSAPHIPWSRSGFAMQGDRLMCSDEDHHGPYEVALGIYIRDRLKSCKRIAYTEMGYAGYINRDREFVDMFGLTNQALAHAPRRYKERTGFNDAYWRKPSSPLYQVLKQTRPDVIIVGGRFSNDPMLQEPVVENYRYSGVVGTSATIALGEHVARVYLAPGIYETPKAQR